MLKLIKSETGWTPSVVIVNFNFFRFMNLASVVYF